MTSPAVAASMTRHSGRIVAVDPAKHTLTLEENSFQGFTESSLEPSAVRPGDYATVTIERIVRPANG
jgi:hypothetical protein